MILAVFDISVAFFHGKVRKVIYVVPPKDLRKKGKIWRLLKSLRPETQYATKEAARFMSVPTRAAKCMLKRLCKYYSEAPVLRWSFPYQEMPTAESEYISITKGAAHALEVRSAVVEFRMAFNVVCETDASAGRAMARRRGVGVVQVRARPGEHNEADL